MGFGEFDVAKMVDVVGSLPCSETLNEGSKTKA
jgi:hypothetical protein